MTWTLTQAVCLTDIALGKAYGVSAYYTQIRGTASITHIFNAEAGQHRGIGISEILVLIHLLAVMTSLVFCCYAIPLVTYPPENYALKHKGVRLDSTIQVTYAEAESRSLEE
jgi:hypothetical protein